MKAYSIIILFITTIGFSSELPAQFIYGENPLASTYSIVARDPDTGEMGVAVQSHWFSVGSIVSWGEAGVGVIATQSFVNPAFGPDGLALMKASNLERSISSFSTALSISILMPSSSLLCSCIRLIHDSILSFNRTSSFIPAS